jgi:hypothetical protein
MAVNWKKYWAEIDWPAEEWQAYVESAAAESE